MIEPLCILVLHFGMKNRNILITSCLAIFYSNFSEQNLKLISVPAAILLRFLKDQSDYLHMCSFYAARTSNFSDYKEF